MPKSTILVMLAAVLIMLLGSLLIAHVLKKPINDYGVITDASSRAATQHVISTQDIHPISLRCGANGSPKGLLHNHRPGAATARKAAL